ASRERKSARCICLVIQPIPFSARAPSMPALSRAKFRRFPLAFLNAPAYTSLMNPKLLSRLFAMLVLGILLAFGMHFRMERRRQAGKIAFIAEQEKRWDRVYAR